MSDREKKLKLDFIKGSFQYDILCMFKNKTKDVIHKYKNDKWSIDSINAQKDYKELITKNIFINDGYLSQIGLDIFNLDRKEERCSKNVSVALNINKERDYNNKKNLDKIKSNMKKETNEYLLIVVLNGYKNYIVDTKNNNIIKESEEEYNKLWNYQENRTSASDKKYQYKCLEGYLDELDNLKIIYINLESLVLNNFLFQVLSLNSCIPVFLFRDFYWIDLLDYFNKLNIKISGGSNTKRHMLSNIEFNLSKFLFYIDPSPENTIKNSYHNNSYSKQAIINLYDSEIKKNSQLIRFLIKRYANIIDRYKYLKSVCESSSNNQRLMLDDIVNTNNATNFRISQNWKEFKNIPNESISNVIISYESRLNCIVRNKMLDDVDLDEINKIFYSLPQVIYNRALIGRDFNSLKKKKLH